jgi:hypothetical protein
MGEDPWHLCLNFIHRIAKRIEEDCVLFIKIERNES